MPTSPPSLGHFEPQLDTPLGHPPVPGSRETRPGPSPPPTAVDQTHGQGMGIPWVAIPQCTVPQREHIPWGIKGTGPPPRGQPVAVLLTKRRGPGCPQAPLSLHFCLSGRASSLRLFQPISLLSTPTLLNCFISITKEKYSGGGVKYLGVYYHIHINMLILSFLKQKLDVIILQTTLYSTCVTGSRTLDTNRAMLVYHNMYAETFLLSYYPCNVRRLLIKAFKFAHHDRISASLPLSHICAQGDCVWVPEQGFQCQVRSLPAARLEGNF